MKFPGILNKKSRDLVKFAVQEDNRGKKNSEKIDKYLGRVGELKNCGT